MRKIFNYYIYDILKVEDNKEIEIKNFSYDSTTLVCDFYNRLLNEYVVKNRNRVVDYQSVLKNIEFYIPDLIKERIIDNDIFDLFIG